VCRAFLATNYRFFLKKISTSIIFWKISRFLWSERIQNQAKFKIETVLDRQIQLGCPGGKFSGTDFSGYRICSDLISADARHFQVAQIRPRLSPEHTSISLKWELS
jgi:hypothetical protein